MNKEAVSNFALGGTPFKRVFNTKGFSWTGLAVWVFERMNLGSLEILIAELNRWCGCQRLLTSSLFGRAVMCLLSLHIVVVKVILLLLRLHFLSFPKVLLQFEERVNKVLFNADITFFFYLYFKNSPSNHLYHNLIDSVHDILVHLKEHGNEL